MGEELEDLEENFERLLVLQQRKRELELELSRRKAGYQSLIHHLNKKWDQIMRPMLWSPIPSDDEISASGYSSTRSNEDESPKAKKLKTQEKEAKLTSSTSSTSHLISQPPKLYRISTAKLMFRWAQSQDDFAVAKQRTREDGWRDEATLEKKAFFKYCEQITKERHLRLKNEKKHRQQEWDIEKRKKEVEMKGQNIEEFQEWVKKEEGRRNKEYQEEWQKDLLEFRSFYLGNQEDIEFPLGSEPEF